jgi:CheY-like chemotaxis protein
MSSSPKLEVPSEATASRAQEEPVRSVLIADDHDDTRLMLRTILELNRFLVLEAADGETAVALTVSERPDIVLMDFSLPVLDGLGALRLIKANHATRNVPIIFLSGRAEPAPQLAAREAGCNDFLVKPIHLDKMMQLIEQRMISTTRMADDENR